MGIGNSVANYREAVLTGFQQVEDALADLRILAQETDIVDRAVVGAQQSLDISAFNIVVGSPPICKSSRRRPASCRTSARASTSTPGDWSAACRWFRHSVEDD